MPNEPAQPQGIPESVTFGRFDGLKNTVDRERLGEHDLAVAVNIDLDDDGQPHRRRGQTLVVPGVWHSLMSSDGIKRYGVKDGDLGLINPDYSFDVLVAGVGGDYAAGDDPIAYWQLHNDIYFTATYCSGIIDTATDIVRDWGPSQNFWYSPVVDPSSTLPAIAGKLYGGPPRASHLAYYNGRMYLAAGRMLWATVFNAYHLVDKTRGFIQFEADITMVGVVSDGMYVSTTEGVWFLQGGSFETLKRSRVMDSSALKGSMVYIPGELANPPQVGSSPVTPMMVSIGFFTTRGFCVGEDGGHCTNLTEGKFFFPVAQRAAAFWRRQDGMNQYVICLDSEGGPLNGARFGKYVDPAIQRGKAMWIDVCDFISVTENYT